MSPTPHNPEPGKKKAAAKKPATEKKTPATTAASPADAPAPAAAAEVPFVTDQPTIPPTPTQEPAAVLDPPAPRRNRTPLIAAAIAGGVVLLGLAFGGGVAVANAQINGDRDDTGMMQGPGGERPGGDHSDRDDDGERPGHRR